MNYLQFDFEIENPDQSEQLVALLNEQDFEGFEEEPDHLKAFIAEDKFNEKLFAETINNFASIAYSRSVVENINWNAQWESSFQPILVNDKVAIRAGFHPPFPNVQYEIVITPKMSFGTGHHATTYLMIEQMLSLDFSNKTVLDFGTGTGILAILAEKMGAASVVAIDNDEWSIENAKENIAANNCNKIDIQKAETAATGKQHDIILANINLNVILANLPAIAAAARSGAHLLFSGFLKSDEATIAGAFAENGFTLVNLLQRGDWICIHATKI